jgi:hypothetical protein
MIAPRRPPSVIESFNFAIEGIIHVLRTQRNMRIHFAIAVAVLVAALAFDVSRAMYGPRASRDSSSIEQTNLALAIPRAGIAPHTRSASNRTRRVPR